MTLTRYQQRTNVILSYMHMSVWSLILWLRTLSQIHTQSLYRLRVIHRYNWWLVTMLAYQPHHIARDNRPSFALILSVSNASQVPSIRFGRIFEIHIRTDLISNALLKAHLMPLNPFPNLCCWFTFSSSPFLFWKTIEGRIV